MSARVNNVAIDLRAIFATAQSTQSLTVHAKINQITDHNVITPVLMLADDFGQSYGVYTTADGQSLVFSGGGGYDPSSSFGAVAVGTIKGIGFTGGASNHWTPYVNGAAGSVWTPTLQTPFNASSIWLGNDAASGGDLEFGYITVLNFEATAAQMAAMNASPTPWALFDPTTVLLKGSCVGADIATIIAGITGQSGYAVNGGTATRSATDASFGPTASGSCVLPIA